MVYSPFFAGRGLEFSAGEGNHLTSKGRSYLDLGINHGCTPIGYNNSMINQIVSSFTTPLYVSQMASCTPRNSLHERLLQLCGYESMDEVFFSNSGTEAVEAALKVAMIHTGRDKIVAIDGSFHGRSLGALATTSKEAYRTPFLSRMGETMFIPRNDVDVVDSIEGDVAAVILEAIQGESGINALSGEFIQAIRNRCDEIGALLIVDEIQCGMFRTGRFLGIHHHDVTPDIITMAKGLASGMPLGATVFSSEFVSDAKALHGTTFGGNPLACAIALETIDQAQQSAQKFSDSQLWVNRLSSLLELQQVVDIRGMGAMIGIQLNCPINPVLQRMQRMGVLAIPGGVDVIRFLPSYDLEDDDFELILKVMSRILGAMR